MLLPQLDRHLYVCGLNDVLQVLRRDPPQSWHVLSILEPTIPRKSFPDAKSTFHIAFYDVENAANAQGMRAACAADLTQILAFVDALPPEGGLLVHCRAGISRSAAVALGLIIRGFVQRGDEQFEEEAVQQLLELRPQAAPNALVLRLLLETFMTEKDAEATVIRVLNHPRFMENRFINPLRQ
jgi:predicted protein tyrosine phosphatase